MPDRDVHWCCTCGEVEPDSTATCPVSELWMRSMGVPGLRHLIAYGVHPRALAAWTGAAEWRAKAGITREAPDHG